MEAHGEGEAEGWKLKCDESIDDKSPPKSGRNGEIESKAMDAARAFGVGKPAEMPRTTKRPAAARAPRLDGRRERALATDQLRSSDPCTTTVKQSGRGDLHWRCGFSASMALDPSSSAAIGQPATASLWSSGAVGFGPRCSHLVLSSPCRQALPEPAIQMFVCSCGRRIGGTTLSLCAGDGKICIL